MVSIQSSHISLSKCRCSSPYGNLMSCSFLTPQLCSLSCPSCDDVICGISYSCSFGCLSCGNVIYGTTTICLITRTIIGTTNGSTLPFIIFMPSNLCSLVPFSFLSLRLFLLQFCSFFLKTLLGEYVVAFFLFSNVVLHLLPSSFNLGLWFLWIVFFMHKQILISFQYQCRLTSIFLIPLYFP